MGRQDPLLAHEQENTNLVSMITCCSLDKIRIPLQILYSEFLDLSEGGLGEEGLQCTRFKQ